MKTIICDLDGTVADCSHRIDFIRNKPKNWKAFYAGIEFDEPIIPTIETVVSLWRVGYSTIFLTGRPEEYRKVTNIWLNKHIPNLVSCSLYMRPTKDNRADYIVKEEIFLNIIKQNHSGPYLAFEDRGRVVDMWRRNGVFCFNANQGEDY